MRLGRIDEAEAELVRGALDRSAVGAKLGLFLAMLHDLWQQRPHAEKVAAAMDQLCTALPLEPQVQVLHAQVRSAFGHR